MTTDVFLNISRIIERDSKTTTYKFALLRGVIDIIQENSPFISYSKDRVYFPLGLLIEKWLIYYYPILDSSIRIPQINGDFNLAFETQFIKIINAYEGAGGFSAFYNDLKNKGMPQNLTLDFLELAKKMKDTITRMPMKYIGRSISNNYYSIFQYESMSKRKIASSIDAEFLINNFGSFSIPIDYYEAFKTLGSFIGGTDSIFFKWAEFSVNASGKNLSVEKVVNEILKWPITQREVEESKKMYSSIIKNEGKVYCVWTGKTISKYDIDHLIPFSIWKNNDLWNLLPAQAKINAQKRNKIPSNKIIEKQSDLIIHYWEMIDRYKHDRFQKEIRVSLLGNNPDLNWQSAAINQLKNSCSFLITTRGYEEWNI
ncbi:MAG: hypothetical protein FJW56_03665 [Actinobacteria bacterium]|nr:hypothetical protein [Actinomycetota bacterium]